MVEKTAANDDSAMPILSAALPQRPRGLLSRAQLDLPESIAMQGGGIVSVVAPAGYGKTTTLLSWYADLEERGWKVAWLGLDMRHRDPISFFEGLIAAMRKQCEDFGESTIKHIHSCLLYTSPSPRD